MVIWYIIIGLILFGVTFGGNFYNSLTTKLSLSPTPTTIIDAIEDSEERATADPSLKTLQLDTFTPPVCLPGDLAVAILIDTSGSTEGSRVSKAKEAVKYFASLLENQVSGGFIIGVQQFSQNPPPDMVVPFQIYSAASKATFESNIDGLRNGTGSPIKDGLLFTFQKTKEAQAQFPNRSWTIIILSDGRTNQAGNSASEVKEAAKQIQQDNIRIISLGLQASGKGKELMEDIASAGDFRLVSSPDVLKDVFKNISGSICR